MGIDYAMLPFGPEIADAYARLFPGDADKSWATLSWRFCDNPHGRGMFAVAQENGLIQGMIALVPTKLIAGRKTIRGFQAIDTIVNPELQGKFVFVRLGRLVEDYVAEQGAVLWGFPNAAAARGWFGRLGWTRTGSVPFLIRPLRTGYFLHRFAPALGGLNFRLFRRRRDSSEILNSELGERYQRLWEPVRERLGIAVDRSQEWLRWRLNKPGARYAWSSDRAFNAFVATRTLEKHDGIIAYVMEAAAAPECGGTLTTLLRQELARLGTNAGADVALAWCSPQSPNYACYRAAGFLPFPDRFRPTEIHHGYWQSDGNREAVIAGDPWYLSYLDSDTV